MAIYHLSASIVKRSAGRSVTAAAAYRAAAKIEDVTTGLVHDYTRKKGVDYSEILSPISSSSGNEWLTDRQELWNKIEEVEKRKDAQLAREVTIALPCELPRSEQIALVREYVQTNYVAAGMIADVNLHHLDGDNPHAHILLSMRDLQTSPEGKVEFGLKNTDWNSKELLLTQRKSWEEITNKYLAASGLDLKIDCRSLKDQGSEFTPQIHVGVHAMAMKRKGIGTDRGDEFDQIEADNNDIRARLERIYDEETAPEPEVQNRNKDKDEEKNEDDRIGKLLYQNIKSFKPIHKADKSARRISVGRYLISKNLTDGIRVDIDKGYKLLHFKLENDIWIKTIFYPSKHSMTNYTRNEIDNLVQSFNQVVDNFPSSNIQQIQNKIQQYKNKGRDIDREHELAESIDKLLNKWGQRIFYPANIKLAFYKNHNNEINVYVPERYRICNFEFVGDHWINAINPRIDEYSIDNLIRMVSKQHDRFDTGEIKKLELTPLERQQIITFDQYLGLELNDERLTEIRKRASKQEIINKKKASDWVEWVDSNLASDLTQWIDNNIPPTREILSKDRIKEILNDSSQPVIIVHNRCPGSVYTDYLFIDTQENKVLEFRHNDGILESIDGVTTPLISKQIKIIIDELEKSRKIIDIPTLNVTQQINIPIASLKPESLTSKSEVIVVTSHLPINKLDPIDINLKPVKSLSVKELIEQQQKLDEEKSNNKQSDIQEEKPQRKKSRGFER